MTLYVYTLGHTAEDLPVNVDDNTRVTLSDNNGILIEQDRWQGEVTVSVPDVDALTRALTQVQLVQAERQATDDRPMTDDHRKAIFAGLREVYGKDISRDRRLAIISSIVRREVVSLSVDHWNPVPLTRAEASHVLDVLNA